MKRLLFRLVFLFICTCHFYGQNLDVNTSKSIDEILTFHLLDVESGLSHNVVNSIEQDSLGFIWIATIEGLNRYNGTRFTKFKTDYQNQDSIPNLINNHVQHIKFDHNSNLLIATDGGLNIYNTKYEQFSILKTDTHLLNDINTCLAIGPDKEIIVGSERENYGLAFINRSGDIKTLSHDANNLHSLSANNISDFAIQGDSILWIGTSTKGLNKYYFKTKKTTRIPYSKHSAITSTKINTLYTDSNGNLWIGSLNGLHVITTKGDTLSLKKASKPNLGLSDDSILAFEEDNQNQMWIGTRNGGLNILNISAFLSKRMLHVKWYLPKNDGSSVFNRTVSAIKMDRDENMWLGTSTGLNFVNPKGEPIKLFQKNIDNPEGLAHNRIGAFAEKKDGKIWIGTDGSGLNLFDPKTGQFWLYEHQTNNPKSLSNNYIISLFEDSKERVWIGTYRGGLNKMDAKTGICRHYLQGSTDKGSDVRRIFEDYSGQIWVGTNRGGLYKYIEHKDEFEYIKSLGKIDVRDIKNDSSGFLWMATYGDGVIKYNAKNDVATFYNTHTIKGMTSNVIFSILPLENDDILMGTRYSGLIRLNTKTNHITAFTEKNGLSNNTVSSIIKDNETDIWLGTYEGLSYYNSETNHITNLNTYNNIQRSEFNIGAALKSKSGYLYFGGNKGFNLLHPNSINNTHPKTHRIVFEGLQILNKQVKVSPNSKNAILKTSISQQNRITLNHQQNSFSIDFSVLKFPRANNINYSYLLEGFHNHWVDAKSTGTANLNNIPPGDYTLKVKAKIGSKKNVYNNLSIVITPPFWKTTPAYLLYFILIVASILGVMTYYSQHIKLKNSLLFEKKQRQLEHDFNEERIRFFTSFSHELRTPLTLILGPVEDMLIELRTKKHINNMQLIKKNATFLFQSINKLLEFRKSEVGLSDLVVGKYNLSSIIEQLTENYLLMAEKNDISLSLSLPEKEVVAWFDLEKIQIIINNLLSNAFKHTKEKGKIKVTLTSNSDYHMITVKDTGSGISQKEIDHIFDWYYRSKSTTRKKGSGIGLALSKSFAELHQGKIEVTSKIDKGSVFKLSIPKDESLFSNTPLQKVTHNDTPEKIEISPISAWGPTSTKTSGDNKLHDLDIYDQKLLILLIDDNPDILKYLEGLLKDDYDLLYAENGQQGIDRAIQYVPDLIISDIMMPKKSGIDLCAILKKETITTHIPIILLSAKSNIESIKTGYEIGADDYITKPFSSQLLRARIKNLLDNRILLRKHFGNLEEQDANNISEAQSKLLDKEKAFLKKLELVILKHLAGEKNNVNTIALGIGMSRTSLFRKVKAITGKNINEYVTMVKIKKAASLIKGGDVTISQAAFEVGFSSAKYFSQLFKKQYGIVPSQYKKKHKTSS